MSEADSAAWRPRTTTLFRDEQVSSMRLPTQVWYRLLNALGPSATIDDICMKTRAEWARYPGFGKKSLDLLESELDKLGRALNDGGCYHVGREPDVLGWLDVLGADLRGRFNSALHAAYPNGPTAYGWVVPIVSVPDSGQYAWAMEEAAREIRRLRKALGEVAR